MSLNSLHLRTASSKGFPKGFLSSHSVAVGLHNKVLCVMTLLNLKKTVSQSLYGYTKLNSFNRPTSCILGMTDVFILQLIN